MPVSGGREVQVYDFPDRPAAGRWGITTRGVYFARRQDDRWLFFLLDFASQGIRPVAAGRLRQADYAMFARIVLYTIRIAGSGFTSIV